MYSSTVSSSISNSSGSTGGGGSNRSGVSTSGGSSVVISSADCTVNAPHCQLQMYCKFPIISIDLFLAAVKRSQKYSAELHSTVVTAFTLSSEH
jgi:hypothetical protein